MVKCMQRAAVSTYPVVSCGFCLEVFPQRLRKGECLLRPLFDGWPSRSKRRLPLLPASSHPETAPAKEQSTDTIDIIHSIYTFDLVHGPQKACSVRREHWQKSWSDCCKKKKAASSFCSVGTPCRHSSRAAVKGFCDQQIITSNHGHIWYFDSSYEKCLSTLFSYYLKFA